MDEKVTKIKNIIMGLSDSELDQFLAFLKTLDIQGQSSVENHPNSEQ